MPVWDSLNLNAPHTERELSSTTPPPSDPTLTDVWYVEHEVEIWCGENNFVAYCESEELAQYITSMHNNSLRKVN